MIKQIIILLALMATALCAAQNIEKPVLMNEKKSIQKSVEIVKWESDFNTAIERAKKEKKPLMLVVSKTTCKWCYHYKEHALVDPLVVKAINRDFVPLLIEMNGENLPQELWTPGTPATWFIDNSPQPMFQPLMGSQPKETLLTAFSIVSKTFNESNSTK